MQVLLSRNSIVYETRIMTHADNDDNVQDGHEVNDANTEPKAQISVRTDEREREDGVQD